MENTVPMIDVRQISYESIEELGMEASLLSSLKKNVKINSTSLARTIPFTIRSILDPIKELFGYTDGTTYTINRILKYQTKIIKISKNISFGMIQGDIVPCPEGLNSTLVDYGNELYTQSKKYFEDILPSLDDFNRIILTFIGNREIITGYKEIKETSEDIMQSLAKDKKALFSHFLDKNIVKDRATIRELLHNFNDLQTINGLIRNFKSITNMRLLETIKKSVNTISDNLRVLLDLIDKNEVTNITSQNLKIISDASYQIARNVEYVSILYYSIMVYVGTVLSLYRHIIERNEEINS